MNLRIALLAVVFAPGVALADPGAAAAFTTGPVIKEFGPAADVADAAALPSGSAFNVSFDVKEQSAEKKPNRTLVSAARFLNMHARAGVDPKDIALAVVVHGKAVHDVTRAAADNLPLIAALQEHNVDIIVCGQSASYYGVSRADLAPGVDMALSAMTAHAQLQQQGYTLNPF